MHFADIDRIGGAGEFGVRLQRSYRVTDAVKIISRNQQILRWHWREQHYEVVDVPLFKEQFNTLRYVRRKRKIHAPDRPFAGMHVHFIMIRGEKWAETGSCFRPKHLHSDNASCPGEMSMPGCLAGEKAARMCTLSQSPSFLPPFRFPDKIPCAPNKMYGASIHGSEFKWQDKHGLDQNHAIQNCQAQSRFSRDTNAMQSSSNCPSSYASCIACQPIDAASDSPLSRQALPIIIRKLALERRALFWNDERAVYEVRAHTRSQTNYVIREE